ncbi:MAG: hypothetical protein WBO09_13720 [Methylocystis silviterrae]|uniref:hypothetical protein n=1 Tax=Methylocystis silviterrae TaxID=2743612 RepID=UPI003BCC7861
MNVMHLSVTFHQQCDATPSVRAAARREAITRLQNTRSVFDVLTDAQVAAFAASNDAVTLGNYDPEVTTHEPIED